MTGNQEHIPLFYEGQDDLVDILATSMASVCYTTKSFIDFYILDCGICDFNKRQLESLRNKFSNFSLQFIPIDLGRFKDLKGWPPPKYKYVDCYARLLIPELKPEIDRAIYLDSDTILLDDIRLLWEQDLAGYETGLVADIGYDKFFYDNCVCKLGVSAKHVYANAGVMLIDCRQWRKHNLTENLLQIARENKENLLVLHEDMLSIYYNGNRYKRLDNRFNLTDRNCVIYNKDASAITDAYIENEWRQPVVYHFCHVKPFKLVINEDTDRPIRHFDNFWFFAQMTPFYAGMRLRFEEAKEAQKKQQKQNKTQKERYSLFGVLPLITVLTKKNIKRYKLFGFLPIMKKKG